MKPSDSAVVLLALFSVRNRTRSLMFDYFILKERCEWDSGFDSLERRRKEMGLDWKAGADS